MRSTILLVLCGFFIGELLSFKVPEATFELLKPKGFRVSIPGKYFTCDIEGIKLFAFHGNLNEEMNGREGGRFSQDVLAPKDKKWIYENHEAELKPGDVINYWTYVDYKDDKGQLGYANDDLSFHVAKDIAENHEMYGNKEEQHPHHEGSWYDHAVHTPDCKESLTTVSGKWKWNQICSGQLIFADEFDFLDLKKWKHANTLSGGRYNQFQWFTNNRTNSFVKDGVLYIKPTLTADQLGEDALHHDILQLHAESPGERCLEDPCIKKGYEKDIINPVKSARLSTERSFSFKYGKIVIRAKNPSGDWLWPSVRLIPLDNTYGNFPASGEITLVEARGNEALHWNGHNIGNQMVGSMLLYGSDLAHVNLDHTYFYKWAPNETMRDFTSRFHTYTMIWKPDTIRFMIDDLDVGSVHTNNHSLWQFNPNTKATHNPWLHSSPLAPFDQEFFISIGLGVGGTNGFFPDQAINKNGPKPWKNWSKQPANEFWHNHHQWLPTWNLHNSWSSAFQIDYVQVYAL